MSDTPDHIKKPGLWSRLAGTADLQSEKARLEAFLDAMPGAYCGWSPSGAMAYNRNFGSLLGLAHIKAIDDIQHALSPSDAAVLEGLFATLQGKGQAFSVSARTADGRRTLRLTGTRGRDSSGGEHFDILWLEDVTAVVAEREAAEKARQDAEAERDRLQAALDHVPLPLWIRNARTDLVWANRAYAQALDTTSATVVAEQKDLSLKSAKKGGAPLAARALAQAALDGQAQEVQAHAILGGRRHLLRINETPLPAYAISLGMARDITREEELETEQKRYSAAYKELLEQLGSAIAVFDGQQKLEFFNSAFAQLWGLEDQYLHTNPKLGDLMEKLRETRRLPEQADFRRFKQGWLNMFTGLLQPHEEMLYLPDGSALRMLVVPHPMGGLMMTFEDVTSRLELESSYNTLIAVQKETLDNLAEGVVVFGGDGRVKLWNPAFARLWGLNPEDLAGEPHFTRLTDKMKGFFRAADWPHWQKILVSQSLDRAVREGQLEKADGALVHYSTVPLPDGGVLVTHVDVTDTVKVENALREKNAALETAERLKLDFLANVSYQLRTPLNAIMGFSEILSHEYFGALNGRQKEYTGGIQDAGDRLLHLIDDILDLSTIEAGYMELNKDHVEVCDIVDSVSGLTEGWLRKEKVTLALEYDDDAGTVFADKSRIKQVLLNLVRNAIAHSPQGGVVRLSVRRGDGEMLFAVTDSGGGIAPEDQARIFEPFERAQAGAAHSNKSRGAGLGLTLVKNIVELHGGKIVLESVVGQGSTFTIRLPLPAAQTKQAAG